MVFGKIRNVGNVKKKSNRSITCPQCNERIKIGLEISEIPRVKQGAYLPHIHLHGTPLHALVCYVNSELEMRNVGVIKSIEISRDSATFKQLMKKWTNPY